MMVQLIEAASYAVKILSEVENTVINIISFGFSFQVH
jgi:hypothetical protein